MSDEQEVHFQLGRLRGEFVVTWYERGKRHRRKLFTADEAPELKTKREAEKRIRKLYLDVEVKKTPIVETLWNAYCKEKAGKRAVKQMGFEWKHLGPHFGHLEAREVTTDLCREYVEKRRATKKPTGGTIQDGTIWTELGHLRTVLKWAADTDRIPKAPPIERPAKPKPKDRFLTRAEAERLLDSAPQPHIRLAILLLLGTAGRISAVLELEWSRVDFERGQIDLRIESATTLKGRAVVPMNAGLRAALDQAKREAMSDHVIEWNGRPVASIKTGFNAAVKASGLDWLTPHDLRRTAARWMVEAGRPMEEVSQYLGHSNLEVTRKVYGRYSPGALQEAANVLDFVTIKEARK